MQPQSAQPLDWLRDLTTLIRLENETLARGDMESAAQLLAPKQRALAQFVCSLDRLAVAFDRDVTADQFREEIRTRTGELAEALAHNGALLRTAIAVRRRIVQAVLHGVRHEPSGYGASGKAVTSTRAPMVVDRRL